VRSGTRLGRRLQAPHGDSEFERGPSSKKCPQRRADQRERPEEVQVYPGLSEKGQGTALIHDPGDQAGGPCIPPRSASAFVSPLIHLPVSGGTGIHIHHRKGIGPPIRIRVHRRHIGRALRGHLHGEPRGRIEAGVEPPERHRSSLEGLGIHGNFAKPAGAHVVNEAADGVFMEQEGAGLKPSDGLSDILLQIGEGLEGEGRPDPDLRLDAIL